MKKKINLLLCGVILLGLCGCGKKDLTCVSNNEYEDYTINTTDTYTFDNDKIKSYENKVYMKFNDSSIMNSMYEQLSPMEEYFSNIDGLTYKITINENDELKVLVKIDDVSAIPTIFESFTSEIEGINQNSTKDEIIKSYEDDDFVCN